MNHLDARKVEDCMRKYSSVRGEPHFRCVTKLACTLFEDLKSGLAFSGDQDVFVLWAAAMLHDIGTHAKLAKGRPEQRHGWWSADYIMANPLTEDAGVNVRVAKVVSLHKLVHDTEADPVGEVYEDLVGRDEMLADKNQLKLAAVLRVADGLDRCLSQDADDLSWCRETNTITVTFASKTSSQTLEYLLFQARKKSRLLAAFLKHHGELSIVATPPP